EIIPDDEATRLQHAHHFLRDPPLQFAVEDRSEHGELSHYIELRVGERKTRGIGAEQPATARTEPPCGSDAVGEQVHSADGCWTRSPLHELPKPIPRPAADLEN